MNGHLSALPLGGCVYHWASSFLSGMQRCSVHVGFPTEDLGGGSEVLGGRREDRGKGMAREVRMS